MKITVEISLITVFLFAHPIGQGTNIGEGGFFKKCNPFIKRDSLLIDYFFTDLFKLIVLNCADQCLDACFHNDC